MTRLTDRILGFKMMNLKELQCVSV